MAQMYQVYQVLIYTQATLETFTVGLDFDKIKNLEYHQTFPF